MTATEGGGSDAVFALYNEQLIALSSAANVPRILENPDLSAHAVSPICGSEVSVALKMSGGAVTDFGFEVEACALAKTVVAVMARAIIGKTRDDIRQEGIALEAMLEGAPYAFQPDWKDLEILLPVKDYKARHNSILLPFEAVEKAFNAKS